MSSAPSSIGVPGSAFTPGSAYWNQRLVLARSRERIEALSRAVDHASDLSLVQFAQLFASALEFAPDLIVELGRGWGNSTCAFTEAANQLSMSSPCRVLSICECPYWDAYTKSRVQELVLPSWFNPLHALRGDILKFDFSQALSGAKRVLVFWDAHGFEVAECVLGVILPELLSREHIVLMHDMSDIRYSGLRTADYAGQGIWKGQNAGEARLLLGFVDSAVAQAISIQDFASRNRLTVDSADHSIDLVINQVPGRAAEMRDLLGDEIFSLQGHWFWFTLNEHPGPYTFPRFTL